jgi:hypothetical protein
MIGVNLLSVTMLNVTAPVNTHPNRERKVQIKREREREREREEHSTQRKKKKKYIPTLLCPKFKFYKTFFRR